MGLGPGDGVADVVGGLGVAAGARRPAAAVLRLVTARREQADGTEQQGGGE
ncbi:hypothetical protein ACFQX7_29925 [Luedemannella flava]